jgi:hypothetical protein
VQLTGGNFQDSEGNVLVSGYLVMHLSQDGHVSGVGEIASGIDIRIQLDPSGNVVTSPAQSVWGVDQMLPINNYYRVTGYTAAGQPAWGPNNQQVTGSGGTFDIGTWVPNQVLSWQPPVQTPLLEVNDVPNLLQTVLNLEAGSGITLTDEGDGGVTIASSVASLLLEVNDVPNTVQNILNLEAGTNIILTDEGDGGVTIDAKGGASFDTAGEGFFWGPGIVGPFTFVGSSNLTFSGNTVYAFKFILQSQFTIRNCSYVWTNNFFGGQTLSFAIYDHLGNKVIDSGAFDLSLATTVAHTQALSPVVLPPGVYYFAQAEDASGLAAPTVNIASANPSGTAFANLSNAIAPNIVTAANARAAGIMPATLGVLTGLTDSSSVSICTPLWTP